MLIRNNNFILQPIFKLKKIKGIKMRKRFLAVFLFLIAASLLFYSCSTNRALLKPDKEELASPAPDSFKVKFYTSAGNFILKVKREYSPLGVDRFYYLCKNKYYYGNRFFRVVPNFVVQWGINGNPEINKVWEHFGIPDEPVKLSNKKGTIAFARGGKNTRSNQLYINLKDNLRLDNTTFMGVKGFPAFGKVIKGMENVEKIFAGYREKPNQDSIQIKGNEYLKRKFPKLDYIIKTEILEED